MIAIDRLIFFIFLAFLPIQTRILFNPEIAYIDWYFDYHLAFFLYFTDILFLTCFTAWLIFNRPDWSKLRQNRLFLLILGFLGIALVSLFHVKQLSLGVYQTIKWLEFFLILIYVQLTFRKLQDFNLAAWIIYLSALFQAGLGLIQFHVQHLVGLTWLGEYIAPLGTSGLATIETISGKVIRAYGTMPHPNVLAAFLVLGLIFGLYLLSQKKSLAQHLFVETGLFIILMGIFVTFSRLAWIAAIVACGSFIIYNWFHNRKKAGTIVFVMILVFLTIGIFYGNNFKARATEGRSTSLTDRYFFNDLGLNFIKKYPMLGVGVGNYVNTINDLYQLEPWQHQPAHNIFIFIASELGLLGLGLFIMILLEVFSKLGNVLRNPISFTLVTIGLLFLILGQFDHYLVTIQQGRLMFAVVLGLIAAAPNLHDDQKTD